MTYLVSITSQGQISIPADIRKALSLSRFNKVFVSLSDSKILIEPVEDLLSLEGTLSHKAKKMPFSQIRQQEKQAFSESIKDKYQK